MEQTKIKVSDMNLYYGENHALENINIDIYDKNITALILPFRLRQIHFPKKFKPDERFHSQRENHGRY